MKKIHILFFLFLFFQKGFSQPSYFSAYLDYPPTVPDPGIYYHSVHHLKNNSGYLLLGNKYSGNTRYHWLIKTNSQLGEQWVKKFDFSASGLPFNNIEFWFMDELPNGNYLVAGNAGGNPLQSPAYCLAVFDTNGTLVHARAFYDTVMTANLAGLGMIKIDTSGNILIGVDEYERYGFVRLDTSLNLISHGFYKAKMIDTYCRGFESIWTNDNNFLHSGNSDGDLVLTKTTPSGTLIWSKTYPSLPVLGRGLYQDTSGTIFLGGIYNFSSGGFNSGPCLIKFDSLGNFNWLRYYDKPGVGTNAAISSVFPLPNNNFILHCDSFTLRVNASGTALNSYYYQADNLSYLLRNNVNDMFLMGNIMHDSSFTFLPTVVKFDSTLYSNCFYPVNILTVNVPYSQIPTTNCIKLNTGLSFTNLTITDSAKVIGYKVKPACLGTSIEEMEAAEKISLFPNPVSNDFFLSLPQLNSYETLFLTITDLSGKIIFSEKVQTNSGIISHSANDLANGIYMIQLRAGRKLLGTKKLVVVH